jgi:glycosyltransferase involved in cell wall biosynthesis
VLEACTLTTSDSQVMAERMRELGAREVRVFAFGLEAMPDIAGAKSPWLFFANRGLEPVYAPERVLGAFAAVAAWQPAARLVVANDGSLRDALELRARQLGIAERVRFVGRLDTATQAACYAQARWFVSLPASDSVSVSVLEAMAHGCLPVLSDLPANRELVRDGDNGLILPAKALPQRDAMERLAARADAVAAANRAWVQSNALFGPSVDGFLRRLSELRPA